MSEEKFLIVDYNLLNEDEEFSDETPIEEFYKKADEQYNVFTVKEFVKGINNGDFNFLDSYVKFALIDEENDRVIEIA